MSDQDNISRANDLAMQIATYELLRLLISELCFTEDREAFRKRLETLELAANDSLRSRQHFPQANEQTEAYIKEAACGFVTRLIASVRHPND